VNQRNTQCRGFFGEDAWCHGVDGESRLRFGLGLIDRSVRCGVDDQVGTNALNLLTQLLRVGQVELTAPRNNQFAKRFQVMLQFS